MDGKRADAKCFGPAGLIEWLKSKMGIGMKSVPMPPLVLTTPQKLDAEKAEKAILQAKADLEKQFGEKFTIVDLGLVKIVKPCQCKICQMRAKAQWN